MLGVVILIEGGRRIILASTLYRLNLHVSKSLTDLPAPRAGQKILIFAPHEDDETLGCAGYIQQAVAAGAQVHLVMMTNGEFPEIDVFLFERTLVPNPQKYLQLGYRRQQETLAAMRYLGVPPQSVTFLGYPNEYLNQMWLPAHWLPNAPVRSIRTHSTQSPYTNSFTPQAVYCGESVLRDVETLLKREQPDIVITLHPNDIHVDHWPTYTFVRYALAELRAQGEPFAQRVATYSYLIHRPAWPAPRGYWPTLSLEPPASLITTDTHWCVLPMTVAQTIDKHKATARYRTQAGSFDPLLRSFARTNELYGILPAYRWPAQSLVPRTEVLRDAPADLTSSALNAHGDILQVSMMRTRQRLAVSMRLRGSVSPKLTYHFSIHAGGNTPGDRIIAEYDWREDNARGLVYNSRGVHRVSASDRQVYQSENTTLISVPWPMVDNRTQFFFIRAWTSSGRRTVDQTLTRTYQIGGT